MFIDEQIINDGKVGIVRIHGEFWEEEWTLLDKVKRLIDQEVTNVVVDLSHSTRINSQGIGVLVSCLTSLRDAGGNLKIAGANTAIAGVLKLVNLYTVLEIHETAEEAAASF